MKCFADTPCTDEAWLERLEEMQSEEDAPETGTTTAVASTACANREDCPRGQFCAESALGGRYCAKCLPNGTGCSTEQVCAASPDGELMCYDKQTPAENANVQQWQMRWEDPPAEQSRPALATAYRNPEGNKYFCGVSYETVTRSCLQSKPCENGVATDHCPQGEGCFSQAACREEYAWYDALIYGESTRMSFAAIDISVEMFSQEELEALRLPLGDSPQERDGENDGDWNGAGNIVLLNPATARRGSATFLCLAFALGGFFVM